MKEEGLTQWVFKDFFFQFSIKVVWGRANKSFLTGMLYILPFDFLAYSLDIGEHSVIKWVPPLNKTPLSLTQLHFYIVSAEEILKIKEAVS